MHISVGRHPAAIATHAGRSAPDLRFPAADIPLFRQLSTKMPRLRSDLDRQLLLELAVR